MSSERKKDKNAFASQRFLIKLAETFNMFMVIDALKNMKSSLNNDFAMYKRYVFLFFFPSLVQVLIHPFEQCPVKHEEKCAIGRG